MIKRSTLSFFLFFTFLLKSYAAQVFIPMDDTQKDHLKAYGIAFWVLQNKGEVDWLLNYRGGSFAFTHTPAVENELAVRGVTFSVISAAQYASIEELIKSPTANMDIMK